MAAKNIWLRGDICQACKHPMGYIYSEIIGGGNPKGTGLDSIYFCKNLQLGLLVQAPKVSKFF